MTISAIPSAVVTVVGTVRSFPVRSAAAVIDGCWRWARLRSADVEGSPTRIVGADEALRAALATRFAILDDDATAPLTIVICGASPGTGASTTEATTAGEAEIAISRGIIDPFVAMQGAHSHHADRVGRIVVVHRDPAHGTVPARAAAAGAASLVGSLAAEWGPTTTFATVSFGPNTSVDAVADACRFASDAPAGTAVELGSPDEIAST